MSTELLLHIKPVQKLITRASILSAFIGLIGCPQQVRPSVTEVQQVKIQDQALIGEEQLYEANLKDLDQPAIDKTTSDQPFRSQENIVVSEIPVELRKDSVIPEQPNWNKRQREIARTELSPKGKMTPDTKTTATIELINVTPLPAPNPIHSIDETLISRKPLEIASEQINRQNPEASIRTLDSINLDKLSETEQADVLRIKARAHRQMGMQIPALRFEAERLKFLINPSLNASVRGVLGELETLQDSLLLDLGSGNDQLAGLASAIKLKNSQEPGAISQWLRKYRIHPLLKANLADYQFLTTDKLMSDFRLTVLLPLSGDLANAGRAIRDGILFEFQRRNTEVSLDLQIIDTATLTMNELIALGQSEEAEFIIGPLKKDLAKALLKSKPKIPVLVLNRVQMPDIQSIIPAYSLSLSIEDDGESAVEQIARINKKPRIVTLYTDSPLGLRAAKAIVKRLILVGGSNGGQFALDSTNPETAIIKSFGVADSENRRRNLSKILDLRLQHTPRIRQDMSSVVIHTNPKRVQQIRPLLDYYYLDKTPVYMIGAYRPDLKDILEDLRHTNLIVTPWDLGTSGKKALEQRPLAQGALGSLVAIGIDAMDMALRLGFGMPTSVQGQTGYLTLGKDSTINRQLSKIKVSKNKVVVPIIWKPVTSLSKADIFNAQQ